MTSVRVEGVCFDLALRQTVQLSKDVHIVVPFEYLLSSYSKFEWAENAAVQALAQKS